MGDPFWDAQNRQWIVLGHQTCLDALNNDDLSNVRWPADAGDPQLSDRLVDFFKCQLELADPPEHSRTRRCVARAFSHDVVLRASRCADRHARELIDQCTAPTFDLITDWARPLLSLVLMDMIGILPEERKAFQESCDRLVKVGTSKYYPADDAEEAVEYLRHLIIGGQFQRESSVGKLRNSDLSERLSIEEIIANVVLIYAAGQDTTSNLVGCAALDLFENPPVKPKSSESLVEDALRASCPIQALSRIAKRDVLLATATVRAGDKVLIILGSANIDPSASPTRMHMAFGAGRHRCLGSKVAKAVAIAALDCLQAISLGDRASILREDIRWHDSPAFFGPASMPMRWHS